MISGSVLPTRLEPVTLFPGDEFQAIDSKHESSAYQFLSEFDSLGNRMYYLHDKTHGKFIDVTKKWFANRTIRIIGGV